MVLTDLSAKKAFIQERLTALGYELWGLEFVPARSDVSDTLRLYIEHPKGVTLDSCVSISKRLDSAMRTEGLLTESESLEVSSPGVERKFFAPTQCAKYLGETVAISLRTSFTLKLPKSEQSVETDLLKSGNEVSEGQKDFCASLPPKVKKFKGTLKSCKDDSISVHLTESKLFGTGDENLQIRWIDIETARLVHEW